MNEVAGFLVLGVAIASSVLLFILCGRGRDGHWAHKREMRGWVTPPHATHARFIAGQQWTDDTGRPG